MTHVRNALRIASLSRAPVYKPVGSGEDDEDAGRRISPPKIIVGGVAPTAFERLHLLKLEDVPASYIRHFRMNVGKLFSSGGMFVGQWVRSPDGHWHRRGFRDLVLDARAE